MQEQSFFMMGCKRMGEAIVVTLKKTQDFLPFFQTSSPKSGKLLCTNPGTLE